MVTMVTATTTTDNNDDDKEEGHASGPTGMVRNLGTGIRETRRAGAHDADAL